VTIEPQRDYTWDREMSTHLNLTSEDREWLAAEMEILPEDVDAETLIGYVEELLRRPVRPEGTRRAAP
jgi:hypothetical protein